MVIFKVKSILKEIKKKKKKHIGLPFKVTPKETRKTKDKSNHFPNLLSKKNIKRKPCKQSI